MNPTHGEGAPIVLTWHGSRALEGFLQLRFRTHAMSGHRRLVRPSLPDMVERFAEPVHVEVMVQRRESHLTVMPASHAIRRRFVNTRSELGVSGMFSLLPVS